MYQAQDHQHISLVHFRKTVVIFNQIMTAVSSQSLPPRLIQTFFSQSLHPKLIQTFFSQSLPNWCRLSFSQSPSHVNLDFFLTFPPKLIQTFFSHSLPSWFRLFSYTPSKADSDFFFVVVVVVVLFLSQSAYLLTYFSQSLPSWYTFFSQSLPGWFRTEKWIAAATSAWFKDVGWCCLVTWKVTLLRASRGSRTAAPYPQWTFTTSSGRTEVWKSSPLTPRTRQSTVASLPMWLAKWTRRCSSLCKVWWWWFCCCCLFPRGGFCVLQRIGGTS